jgi:hypothetical protein
VKLTKELGKRSMKLLVEPVKDTRRAELLEDIVEDKGMSEKFHLNKQRYDTRIDRYQT